MTMLFELGNIAALELGQLFQNVDYHVSSVAVISVNEELYPQLDFSTVIAIVLREIVCVESQMLALLHVLDDGLRRFYRPLLLLGSRRHISYLYLLTLSIDVI